MKIAVASRDGRIINQHFGHAERFLIYEADECGIRFLEERGVEKYCSENPEHLYNPERTKKIFDALMDCSALLVSRIGTIPEKELEKVGITTFILCDYIEEGIKTVLSGVR